MGKPGMKLRSLLTVKPTEGNARMWNSMRQLRAFTTADLIATADVGERNARKYVRGLLDAGYLAVARAAIGGQPQGHAAYRLVKNTGPLPPQISKTGLIDLNIVDPNTMRPCQQACMHTNALLQRLRVLVDIEGRLQGKEHVSKAEQRTAWDNACELLKVIDGGAR